MVLAKGILKALSVADVVTATFVALVAVPVVFWFKVGISAAAIALNEGTPAEPFGAAKNVFAVFEAYGFTVSP